MEYRSSVQLLNYSVTTTPVPGFQLLDFSFCSNTEARSEMTENSATADERVPLSDVWFPWPANSNPGKKLPIYSKKYIYILLGLILIFKSFFPVATELQLVHMRVHINSPLTPRMHVYLLASVVSDSVWHYRLEPTRLLCSWDSPGKHTGVDRQSLLQGIFLTQG